METRIHLTSDTLPYSNIKGMSSDQITLLNSLPLIGTLTKINCLYTELQMV